MLGFRLFLHALRMIIGNFGAAVRISMPLVIVAVVLAWMSVSVAGRPDATPMPDGGMSVPFESLSAGFGATFLVVMILAVVAFLWTAVAWHRFTLLEESPGALLPPWHGGAVWAYFVAGVVITLLMILVGIVIGFVGGFLVALLAHAGGSQTIMAVVFGVVVYVPIVIVSYRISPILPAAAIDRKIGVGDAWRATGGANGALFVLALVTVAVSMAAGAPVTALERIAMPLALIWQALVNWFTLLMGISILTTLYGYFVEKRDLNA